MGDPTSLQVSSWWSQATFGPGSQLAARQTPAPGFQLVVPAVSVLKLSPSPVHQQPVEPELLQS